MPAVPEPRGPPHGGVGVAADPDRDTLRPHGLGQHVDGAHAHVATIEGDGIGRPRLAHEGQVLVGHRPALLERRRADRLELLA